MFRFSLIALSLGFFLGGCATVIRGPNVEFVVISEPEGAEVSTDLETRESKTAAGMHQRYLRDPKRHSKFAEPPVVQFYRCDATPCSLKISRRSNFTLTVEKDGYHTATVDITSGFGRGTGESATGAGVSASGAYIVTYSAVTSLSQIVSLGTVSGSAAAGSTAAGVATGVGVAFIGIDLISGAMLDVRPNPVVLILIPEDEPLPEGPIEIIDDPETVQELLEEKSPELSL